MTLSPTFFSFFSFLCWVPRASSWNFFWIFLFLLFRFFFFFNPVPSGVYSSFLFFSFLLLYNIYSSPFFLLLLDLSVSLFPLDINQDHPSLRFFLSLPIDSTPPPLGSKTVRQRILNSQPNLCSCSTLHHSSSAREVIFYFLLSFFDPTLPPDS